MTAAPAPICRSTAGRSRRDQAALMAGKPIDVQAADSSQAGRITTCTAASAPNASAPYRPTTAKLDSRLVTSPDPAPSNSQPEPRRIATCARKAETPSIGRNPASKYSSTAPDGIA